MAKGQKKSNKETRKPKAENKVQRTIVINSSDEMRNLMSGGYSTKKK